MDVLVIDVGGSSVKLWHSGHQEHRRFESGKELTPEQMVERTLQLLEGWSYEAIALGLPCRVTQGRPVEDPSNLGPGWVAFNYQAALGKPVRIMNDACLQALGSYSDGRMLFLGLGTGVGSALVTNRLVLSLGLGFIDYRGEKVYKWLDDKAFQRLGVEEWRKAIFEIVPVLKSAMQADYVVLGGGNVKELEELPDGVRRGHNRTVVEGGRRLWEELPDPAILDCRDWLILS
jgi:polyphosphate glucokinase